MSTRPSTSATKQPTRAPAPNKATESSNSAAPKSTGTLVAKSPLPAKPQPSAAAPSAPAQSKAPALAQTAATRKAGTSNSTANPSAAAALPSRVRESKPASVSGAAATPTKKTATTGSGTTTTTGSGTTATTGSGKNGAPPPPAPLLRPATNPGPRGKTDMAPPTVATEPTTPGALLLSLAITNGRPFKDHWAFFVGRTINSPVGILLHATGDVRSGFTFQIKRNLDWTRTSSRAQLVDLHWVAPAHFNEAMWNNGEYLTETPGVPVCAFEESAASAPVPDRSLRAADDLAAPRTGRVIQRNCQTWIVEASEKLVEDGMIPEAVLEYLRDIKQ